MKDLFRRSGSVIAATVMVIVACAPAAAPPPSSAPSAPKQPQAPAPAQAPKPSGGVLEVETKPEAAPKPSAPSAAVKKGGILRFSQGATTPHLDPIRSISHLTNRPISTIYNRIVKFERGPKGIYNVVIVPDLAEKWEASPDSLVWTFHLRKGIKWASVAPMNGRELTADDVIWSITQHATHPEAAQKAKFSMIDKIEAVDKNTVRFTLKYFHNAFLFNLAVEPAWILPPEIEKQVGNYKSWLAGTGPFIMTEYNPASSMRYKKNPDSFEANNIALEGMERIVIADKATSIAAFRAGELAFLGDAGGGALTPSEFDSVKRTNPSILSEVLPGQGPKLEIRYGAKPFDDVRVRKAVNHALNREAWIATVAEGKGEYDMTFPGARFPEFALPQEELRKYQKFDPELSKKLLAEAGFPNGFTAKVKWNTAAHQRDVNLYLKQLGDVGIKLDTESEAVDYPAWVSQTYAGKFTHLAAWGYGVAGLYDYFYGLHHSTGQRNGPQSDYKQVDAWLDEAIRTPDKQKQIELLQKVERWALTEGLHILPLTTTTSYLVWHPWLKNYNPAFSGAYENSWLAFVGLDK